MESREILEQKYQALPPEIKYIVELLAYSCCPISKSTLERLELPFEKSKSKRRAIILSLKDYPEIIWPTRLLLRAGTSPFPSPLASARQAEARF